jgi:isopenicillin-N N-acyltransferase like protein
MKQVKRLNLIECGGTPYEIGQQYGVAAKKNIKYSIDALIGRVNSQAQATKAEILSNTRKYLPYVEKFDPVLIQQLKGQADGAEVTFDEVFALRCWFELRFHYKHLTTLCTSFAATGKATRNGKMIIGQNFDVLPGSTLDMVRIKREDGSRELSLVFWGGGELTINSYGVGIVLNVVTSLDADQRLCVPCCCLMPKVMREKRLGDALGTLCTHGRSMLHYMIGRSEGEIFSVETMPDDFNVTQPLDDFLVHTNHYITERFKVGDAKGLATRGGSYVRQQRLNRLMKSAHGDITPERMMEFMSDHNNYPVAICGHPNTEVPPDARSMTVSSVIMVPEEKVMYVTFGNPCEYSYEKYTL